jgi:predicted ATPase
MLDSRIKEKIVAAILAQSNYLGKFSLDSGILSFSNKIWELRQMPSTDGRFNNAYDDAYQHLINNSDWSDEYFFIDRLNLINGENNLFIKFIELIVHPAVRNSIDEIHNFTEIINKILIGQNHKLILTEYFEDLPVYRYSPIEAYKDLPNEIIPNKISIYVYGKSNLTFSFPCFMLDFNSGWNDYNYYTEFRLNYHVESISTYIIIGTVKIMKTNEKNTYDSLDSSFKNLSTDYCSLGQSKEFYRNLKKVLGVDYYSFLLGIRDVANFPKICEIFESDEAFKYSLIRYPDQEQILRSIRFELSGLDYSDYFKFRYKFQPPYSDNPINLDFNFQYSSSFPHRIFALIGKNGSGKTKILSSLANSLSQGSRDLFLPVKPVFGKVITISYSIFDTFEIPSSDAVFNYHYCGFRKGDNTIKSKDEVISEFYNSINTIEYRKLMNDWFYFIKIIFNDSLLIDCFTVNDFGDVDFSKQYFSTIYNKLSSGQSITLFLITEIIANIRFDSLILFDEPETHLHPNGITLLVNLIYEIVNKYNSFCVIATHSPIIIQEIPARNVMVIDRVDNSLIVRKLENDSLGENLTVITQEIFGNREVSRYFVNLISTMVNGDFSFEEIVSFLKSENLPISINIRLLIKSLIDFK